MIQYFSLLRHRHGKGVLVRVSASIFHVNTGKPVQTVPNSSPHSELEKRCLPMQSNLMTRITHSFHLSIKRVERMSRGEERRLDVVLVE
jgi:hypothetical protein